MYINILFRMILVYILLYISSIKKSLLCNVNNITHFNKNTIFNDNYTHILFNILGIIGVALMSSDLNNCNFIIYTFLTIILNIILESKINIIYSNGCTIGLTNLILTFFVYSILENPYKLINILYLLMVLSHIFSLLYYVKTGLFVTHIIGFCIGILNGYLLYKMRKFDCKKKDFSF